MKKDVVIPYRNSFSEELLYCLRSLDNLPHKDVYVIGDIPRLKVFGIPYSQTSDIARNTLNILNLAVSEPDISEEFIWMADDQFILRPIKKVPLHHRGTYQEVLEQYQGRRRYSYYVQRMQRTYKKLLSLGVANPKCYELHIPFVINKSKWLEVSKHITPDVNKISMYANLHNLGGTKTKDVKVSSKDIIPKGTFVSTLDGSFGSNQAGRLIREMFNQKGKYEF